MRIIAVLLLACAVRAGAQDWMPIETGPEHYAGVLATEMMQEVKESRANIAAMGQTYSWQWLPPVHCQVTVTGNDNGILICTVNEAIQDLDAGGTMLVPEGRFLLLHHAGEIAGGILPRCAVGQVAATNYDGKVTRVFDCAAGAPLTPARAAAAKVEQAKFAQAQNLKKAQAEEIALKANLEAAQAGDAYGLLRMGERYRDGDGVAKDTAKARDYLTRAAAAGSVTATEELANAK